MMNDWPEAIYYTEITERLACGKILTGGMCFNNYTVIVLLAP